MKVEVAEDPQLFEEVSRSLCEAVRRSMRVAALNDEGERAPVTQTDFASKCGIARSSLASYLGQGGDAANPTLDVVCRLAEALGMPPAFLLMRPKDWSSIANGTITFMQAAMASSEVGAKLLEHQQMGSMTPSAIAHAAIEVGRLLNVVEDDQNPRVAKEVREFRAAAKASTATVAASIPFGYDGVSKNHLPVVLTLCGIVGNTTARN